ncbi:GPI-anchored protein LLG1-like [Mangifera indica]|uniref:GPI-anchored protein LLG1-like n=1 Tax=Mangifera indica TaxID=29780 RepID=UPI001CFB1359|nr:GPI-anchored protein LLG1-like [Mangifera indica]
MLILSYLAQSAACPVNFEFLNYTIITSQCKGPKFPPDSCCNALKEFACPYTEEINDLTTDCASIMFSYINLYGNNPPGLFAAECREGKEGLACPALPPSMTDNANTGTIVPNPSTLVLMTISFLVLVYQLL